MWLEVSSCCDSNIPIFSFPQSIELFFIPWWLAKYTAMPSLVSKWRPRAIKIQYVSSPDPIRIWFWHLRSPVTFLDQLTFVFNRIQGTVAYMRPLKLQASLQARDPILRISSRGAPFWKGECLGYNAKSNLSEEARRRKVSDPFEVQQSKSTLYNR